MTPSTPKKICSALLIAAVLTTAVPVSPRAALAEEMTPAKRQEFVKSGFQKGKSFYDEGRYEEAFSEWGKIEPFLEETSSVRKVISFLKQRAGQTPPRRSQTAAKPASAPKTASSAPAARVEPAPTQAVKAPAELGQFLDSAADDLRQETRAAEDRAAQAKAAQDETARRVQDAVSKGRQLYDAGRFDEALAEWEKILPEIDDASQVRERIGALRAEKERYSRIQSAPAPSPGSKPSAPDLSAYLRSAEQRVAEESARLEKEQRARSAQITQQSEALRKTQEIFDEGRGYYEKGHYPEAFETWKALEGREGVPADLPSRIAAFQKSAERLEAARAEPVRQADFADASPFDAAAAGKFFDAAAKRFEADLAVAQARKAEADRPLQERRETVSAGFERGRLLYYQGDYEAALDEWEKLLPQFENGSALSKRIQELRRLVDETAQARAAAASAAAPTNAKVQTPAELLTVLEQAEKKLKSEMWEAQSKKSRLIESGKEQTAQVLRSAAEADELFRRGRFTEAIVEWEKVLPSLESSSEARLKLEQLKLQTSNLSALRSETDALAAKSGSAPKVPAKEILSYLEQAAGQVDQEAAKVREQRAQLSRAMDERQSWAAKIFQEGRVAYDKGQFDQAFEQWSKLFVYLKDSPEVHRDFQELKIRYDAARQAKLEAEKGIARSTTTLQAPDGLAQAITDATARFQEEEAAARAQKDRAAQTLSSRQVELAKAYERGRTLLGQGDAQGAVREWEKMSALADPATVKRIEDLKSRAEAAKDAVRQAQEMESLMGKGLSAPQELEAMLAKASRSLDEKIQAMESQAAQARESEAARRARADQGFRAGVEALQKGDHDGAIRKWQEIAPLLEGGKEILAKLEQLSAQSARSSSAREALALAAAAQQEKLRSPQDLPRVLEQVSAELVRGAQEADAKRLAAEEALKRRRLDLDALYARGDEAYKKGRYDEALKVWAGLLPEIEGAASAEKALKAASDDQARRDAARRDADAAQARLAAKLPAPQGFESSLAGAMEGIRKQTESAQLARAESDKALLQKQAALQQSFAKGQALFAQGRYDEGLDEWRRLTPYLEPGSGLPEKLESLARAHREMLDAKKQAVQAAAEDYKGIQLPDGIAAEFEQAAKKLEEESSSAVERSRAAALSLEEKRGKVLSLFESGRKLFAEGRSAEATKTWREIGPYLEPNSPAKALLERVAERQARSEAARAEAERAVQAQSAGVALAPSASKTLEEVSAKLSQQTAEAQETARRAAELRAAREAELAGAFEKGRLLYEQQRYDEAISQWASLEGSLETGSPVLAQIAEVKRLHGELTSAQRSALEAERASGARLTAPADSRPYLDGAVARLGEQVRAAQDSRNRSQELLVSRQQAVAAAFAKGRKLYESGDRAAAFAEWQKIAPDLADASWFSESIEKLKSQAAAADELKGQAQRAAASKPEVTQEMSAAFAQLEGTLAAEAAAARKQISERQAEIAARRGQAESALQKGKTLFGQGDYEAALSAWQQIGQAVPETQPALEALNARRAEWSEARRAAGRAAAEGFEQLKAAAGPITSLLNEAALELEDQTLKAQEQRAQMEKTLSERQAWVASTFERGRALAAEKRFREAVTLWRTLLPHLDDASSVEGLLERVQRSALALETAQAAAESAVSRESGKLAAPAQMSQALAELDKALSDRAAQAENERLASEQAYLQRESAVRSADQEARRLLASGDTAAAIAVWKGVLPQLADNADIAATLERASEAHTRFVQASEAAAAAAAKKTQPLPSPADLSVILSASQQDLRARADEALRQAQRLDQELQDKQAWIALTFQEGKRSLEAGDAAQAVRAWRALVPHVEAGEALESSLQELESLREAAIKADKLSLDAAARKEALLPAPKPLEDILGQMSAQLQERVKRSEVMAAQSIESLAARRAAVDQAVRAASTLVSEGRHLEALQRIEGVLPNFEDQERIRSSVASLRDMLARGTEAARAADEAAARQEAKLPPPEGLDQLLASTQERVSQEIRHAQEEQARMEKASADRQAWIDQVFSAGQDRFSQGRIGEALTEWSKLLPYMDPASGLREKLAKASEDHARAIELKKDAVQFAATELQRVQVPAGTADALSRVEQQLQAQIERANGERADAERALSERKASLESLSNQAQELFNAGRDAEALGVWERFAAELPPSAPERQAIEELKGSLRLRDEAVRAAEQALAAQKEPLPMPPGSSEWIAHALESLGSQKDSLVSEAQRSNEAALSRKQTVQSVFEKGRALYQEGRFTDAAREWETLLPYLEAESGLKGLLESLRAASSQLEEARAASDAARLAEAQRLPAPPQLGDLLIDADAGLRKQIAEMRDERAKTEEGLAARRAQAAALFEKGLALHKQGRTGEALTEWQGLLGLIDASPALNSLLAELKARFEESEAARKSVEQLRGRQPAAPEGFAAAMDEAQKALSAAALKAREDQARLEKEAQEKEAAITAAFSKGRELFAAGRPAEALPLWKDSAERLGDAQMAARIDDLEKALAESQQARKSADEFAATRFSQLNIPSADIARSLEEALLKLQAETASAQKQREEMEKTFSDRQVWVNNTYEQAKSAYQAGKIQESLDLWASLAPALDAPEQTQASIARVREALAASEEAQRAASAAADAGKQPFKTPEGFLQSLEQIRAQLSADTKQAVDKRTASEKERDDKRLWVQFTFQDGVNLYQTGKQEEAFKLWKTLVPALENGPAVQAAIEQAEKERAEASEAVRAMEAAIARQDSKLPPPEALESMLLEARQKLSEQAVSSRSQMTRAEQIVGERQQWIENAFQKGKGFYDMGRYPEAIQEWSAVLPYVEGGEDIDALLTKVSDAYDQMRQAQDSAEQARQTAESKFEAPSDLVKTLETAAQSIREQTQQTMQRRDELQRGQQARREAMETHLRKGQILYESGLLDEAVEEWRALVPFFDDTASLERQLSAIAESRKLFQQAQQEADAARLKQTARLAVPEGLAPYLDKVAEAFKKEAFEAQAARTRSESSYQDKQQWITATFAQGKVFYDQGLYKEAADEWSKLLPYTDESSDLRGRLEAVWTSHREAMEAKRAAVEAVAGEYQGLKLQYTPQMVELLQKANAKIRAEADASAQKRSEVEASVAERKEWTVTTFNKGKIFYDQGRMDEALDQWSRLAPYLDAESPLRQLIETLKVRYNEYKTAQQMSAEQAAQQSDAQFQAAMQQFFSEASAKMTREAEQARRAAEEGGRVMAKRKEWINASYEKGKELYSQGRFTEAVKQWEILQPYLSEAPELHQAIAEAMSKAQQAAQAIQAAEEARARQAAAAALPQEAIQSEAAQQEAPSEPRPAQQGDEGAEPALARPVVVPDDAVFVSGEVTAVDTQGRTLTMKLYTVNKEKSLVIQYDQSTRVEGSQEGNDISALREGSAIDLRYDSSTNKAYYIYVY